MPFGRSPAPPRWWWSKSPVAGSERQPMSTRKSAAASAASSRVRTISSGPWTRPEHGDGEDVVGVEVAGVGGDDGHERARNASCCSTACAHSRSSRSPPHA